jgi:hypothetical protein
MLPPWQWDKLRLKVWSWLKGKPFQGYVQFNVGCDLIQYGNKVETIVGIHLQKNSGENSFEGVQK